MFCRIAAVGAVAGVMLLTSQVASAQVECRSAPSEVGLPEEIGTLTSESVGTISKPNKDTSDEDSALDTALEIPTSYKAAFVVDDGVIATAEGNVDPGPNDFEYTPNEGDGSVTCFPAGENTDLGLVFLRCDGDIGDPLDVAGEGPTIGQAVYAVSVGPGQVRERNPETGDSVPVITGGGMVGSPVVDEHGRLVALTRRSSDPVIEVTGRVLACATTPFEPIDDLGPGVTTAASLPSTYELTMLRFLAIRAGALAAIAGLLTMLRNRLRGYRFHRHLPGWILFALLVAGGLTGVQYLAFGVSGRTW